MALSFSANQFDRTFKSNCLGNWEIPKWHLARPRQRTGSTKVISNDRGHLLPNFPRPTSNPWGNYKNTWQLPEKISKKQIEEINAPLIGESNWYKKKIAKEKALCLERYRLEKKKNQKPKNKLQKSQSLDIEYIPGDLTEGAQQHPSRQLLLQQKHDRDNGKSPSYIPPPDELYLEKHQCGDPIALLAAEEEKSRNFSPHVLGDDVEDNFEKMRLTFNQKVSEKPNRRSPSPIIPAYCNFQMAKKMHQENLDHQPLPDSITDKAFRKILATGYPYPGLDLREPAASGVGIKIHKAGPTHCTKMKIYRPKTCGVVPPVLPHDNQGLISDSNLFRPQSVVNKKMGSMDLAICWDFRPHNLADEPKRSKHIDGTNESAGPAVFTVVRTPRTPEILDTGRSGGVFTNTFGETDFFDKDIMRKKNGFGALNGNSKVHQVEHQQQHTTNVLSDLKCTCGTSPINFINELSSDRGRSKSISRNGSATSEKRKRNKSSPNLSRMAISEEQSKENTNYMNDQTQYIIEKNRPRGKPHTCSKYGPKKNMDFNGPGIFQRTTRLCHRVAPEPFPEEREKQFFKSAFKAGTFNSSDSGCSTMCSSTQPAQKVLVIPRPRNPYMKKKYNIDTLVPPFTCFKGGAGQGGYPEHWRLASVYQHAYKPMEQRRRPLLATVYK